MTIEQIDKFLKSAEQFRAEHKIALVIGVVALAAMIAWFLWNPKKMRKKKILKATRFQKFSIEKIREKVKKGKDGKDQKETYKTYIDPKIIEEYDKEGFISVTITFPNELGISKEKAATLKNSLQGIYKVTLADPVQDPRDAGETDEYKYIIDSFSKKNSSEPNWVKRLIARLKGSR